MISKEMKSRIDALKSRFSDLYETVQIGERVCYRLENGGIIALDYMGPYNALVIEYAESVEDAKQNRFEDGDLFFIGELDERSMFNAMIQEITSQ